MSCSSLQWCFDSGWQFLPYIHKEKSRPSSFLSFSLQYIHCNENDESLKHKRIKLQKFRSANYLWFYIFSSGCLFLRWAYKLVVLLSFAVTFEKPNLQTCLSILICLLSSCLKSKWHQTFDLIFFLGSRALVISLTEIVLLPDVSRQVLITLSSSHCGFNLTARSVDCQCYRHNPSVHHHICDQILENQPSWRIWHMKYLVLKSNQ